MAASNLSFLNELFKEVPVQILPASAREQIRKALDIDFEQLNARERLQLLEGAYSILKLIFLIRENTRNQQKIAFLKRMLSRANSGYRSMSALERRPRSLEQLNRQIRKVI